MDRARFHPKTDAYAEFYLMVLIEGRTDRKGLSF
jgi:hypothetical protein